MDKERRISYIDAMRGFTMILVVYSHICHFCLGDSLIGYNRIFFLFRLPCFFFISGWLFEPVGRRPFKAVVRHKFMVQIVPTFIFLLFLAPPPEFFHQLGTLKGGYWFTFALFEFFLLYMVFERCCSRWSACVALAISVLSFCYAGSMNLWRQSASGFCWQSVAAPVALQIARDEEEDGDDNGLQIPEVERLRRLRQMTEDNRRRSPGLGPVNPVDARFHTAKIRYFWQNCLECRFFYIFLQIQVA